MVKLDGVLAFFDGQIGLEFWQNSTIKIFESKILEILSKMVEFYHFSANALRAFKIFNKIDNNTTQILSQKVLIFDRLEMILFHGI
jgi:hypothetical protein